METNDQKKPSLKACVLGRITEEQVCPRSRLFFHSRECFVWFFWFISVLVGSLAVAVAEYVVFYHQYALYEATHENFFTFFVEALPYLWILAFLVMVGVAVVNLRHTKRGYRKPVWFILASSVVLSFAGGSALQFFGLGNVIDHELGERIEAYRSMGKYEAQLWQAPEEGRLLGVQIYSTTEPEKTMIFRDVAGKQWVVNVAELHPEELEQLASGRSMRLIGVELPGPSPVFHSCGAFGWMYTSEMTTEQHRLEREKFVVRMYEHNRLEQDRRLVAEQTSFASTTLGATSVCADLAVVERLSF